MNAQFGVCVALISLAFAGCGSGDDVTLTDLSGEATFDGKPIAYGQIRFTPDQSKKHSGPQGYATIENGKYDTATNGKGVLPGPHVVTITAFEQKPAEIEDETSPEAMNAPGPIFSDYKIERDIQSPTEDFSVPAEAKGANRQRGKPARRSRNTP